jgi:predicted transcriptional regulator
VAKIAKKRPIFSGAELVELLSRAKEFQAQAEKLQRKATVLMEVLEEIVKASPELLPATVGELSTNPPPKALH